MMKKPSLALINLRSALNVGSILRTADAVSVETIYCVGYTPTPLSPKVAKTALGASPYWEHYCDPTPFVRYLRNNTSVIALEKTPHSTDLFKIEIPDSVCFIVGNEIEGVPERVLQVCDQVCHLPQYGYKESLNVAIAASIALYEFRRRHI